ncbi:hypothetical protein BD769DRAFT_1636819 [Suillus cothurnatus]|nr:hypothetical protein BD769DRAFT_1636819 [Suillus cothurnatus]
MGQTYGDKGRYMKEVMDAEGDIATALEAVDTLAATASQRTGLKIRIPARPKIPTQVTTLEIELMDSVGGLKSRNRIFGEPLTIEEILDAVEEREVGDDCDYEFPGGDNEIVEEVQRQMAIERGDIMEVDSDSEDGDEAENVTPEYTFTQVFTLCQQLEDACLQFGELEVSFDLSKRLRAFRACVRREEIRGAKQTTIDSYFSGK